MLARNDKEFLSESFRKIDLLKREMDKVIIGLDELKEALLIAVLTDGHILIEGEPGLAKTLAAKVFAQCIQAPFGRVSFTTDVMPLDLFVSYEFTDKKDSPFIFRDGPLLISAIFLADELNRTTPKTQSALLEAMEEKQVTYEGRVYKLGKDGVFVVTAVQNPIEREATYPLSEACMERFLIKLKIPFPLYKDERIIAAKSEEWKRGKIKINPIFTPKELVDLRNLIYEKYYPELKDENSQIIRYITRIVREFRQKRKDKTKQENGLIEYGISPRGAEDLKAAARVYAFLRRADKVLPEHVKKMAYSTLRGKFNLTPQARDEGKTHDSVIEEVLDSVPDLEETEECNR